MTMNKTSALLIFLSLAAAPALTAAPRGSRSYAQQTETFDAAGGKAAGGRYSNTASIGGVGGMMHGTISSMIGAALGRYYFAKRFGSEEWHRYAPVLLAGFGCGMGLIAMVAIALGLIIKSVSFLPF